MRSFPSNSPVAPASFVRGRDSIALIRLGGVELWRCHSVREGDNARGATALAPPVVLVPEQDLRVPSDGRNFYTGPVGTGGAPLP